jgi:hypothetical protein
VTATTTAEIAELKRLRVPEQEPGTGEPADPADCYEITPGEDGPEYFDPDLPGCLAAIGRAAWLSVSRPPQHVTRHRPGTPPKTFRRYRGGRDISPVP